MEGSMNLYDLITKPENQLDWVKELFPHLTLIDKDNPRTTEEIIHEMEDKCPSDLHGVFLNALINLPHTPQDVPSTRERYQSVLGGIFQKDVNRGVQSWVSELIQNSVDMAAERIFIKISEESMIFGHNGINDDGRVFNPNQLSYLFSMNTSTKMGDFTKIGQFGVGFKYWWNFFEQVEVIVDDGEYRHSLSLCEDFMPQKSEYNYKSTEHKNNPQTTFKFTVPKKEVQTDELLWLEYMNNEETDIYGDRVLRSLPFIQSRTGGDFEIELISPTSKSQLFCRLIESKEFDGFVLDTIEWGRITDSEENEIYKNYRVSTTLDKLNEESSKDNYAKFREYVINEYRGSQTLKKSVESKGDDFKQHTEQLSDKALKSSRINLLITPDEAFTFPANLFIANSETDSKMSCAFYCDAPWQMKQDRVTLNMATEKKTPYKAWNAIVARFVDRLYSRFMIYCLKDEDNLGFSARQMFELINRPIGSKSILSDEVHDLDNAFSTLYSVPLQDEVITLGHRINHLKETFSLTGNNLGASNKALADLWFRLQASEPGNEKARKWLYNALHKKLAKVKLANNEFAPFTETLALISPHHNFEHDKFEYPPVICRNIGKRIPKIIKEMLTKPNVEGLEPTQEENELLKQQLSLFDDVVRDSKKQLSFANDGEKMICDVTLEDELDILMEPLKIIESESENTILYFLSNQFDNVKQHKSHLGSKKYSLKKAMSFDEAMEKILLQAYELSLENESLRSNIDFKQWLNNNTSTKVWNDVVLLKTPGKEYPILVKLPPRAHMLCVVIGLNGKRHLESIKTDPLDHTEPGIIFHENRPKIRHWGRYNREHVYVTPDYLGPIEDLFNPWQSDKKTPSLDDSENWGWSDMSPNGDTGWSWPQVSIGIDDSEIRANVISRITPVFIDGLHVRQGTTFSGVHRGLRIVDDENNIIRSSKASRLPIEHMASGPSRAENAIEVVQLKFITKSKVGSFDLLSNSIDHIVGSTYYPYRTTKKGDRVWIKEAVKRGDEEFKFTLKPHGQIRVLGLLSAIIEKYNFRSEDESEKQIHFHNLQAISQRLKLYNIKFQNLDHIFDVPLVRGGKEQQAKARWQIGLVGIFIPHHKLETKNYLDDTGKTRLRDSDRFDDLRNNGLSGYFSGKLSRPNNVIEFVREEFKNKTWLPRFCSELINDKLPDSFTTIDKYGIETVPIRDEVDMIILMQYKNSNLNRDISHREGVDSDRWAFRWGLNKLLEIIKIEDDRNEFALGWLEHLLHYKLPMKEWSNTNVPWIKPKLNETPKQILRKAIAEMEHSYPMIAKLCAHEDQIDLWPEFLRSSLVNSDAKKVLLELKDTRLPKIIDIGNGYWGTSQSQISFQRLKNIDETEKLNFILSDIDYFSQRILKISNDMELYHCPSQGSKLKAWNILNEINNKVVNKINLGKKILTTNFEKEQKLLESPKHFKYLDNLVSQLFPDKKIYWYVYSETKSQNDIVAGEGCVAIEIEDENINIRSNKPNITLASDEHDFIAQMVFDFLDSKVQIDYEKLKLIIQQSSEHFPEQIYKILGLDFTLEHRYQFISNYCQGELNFAKFQSELRDVDDEESLESLLEVLKKKYSEEDRELAGQELFLRQLYDSIPSIIQDRNSFTGISNPNNPMTVTRTRAIGHNMVSQMSLKTRGKFSFTPNITGTLGNTLLVNALEADWFGRHVARHDTGEQYDFCEHALRKMEEALFAQWFNPNTNFVTVDEVFVDQDQKRFAGKFHRIHLIHIIACLSVYVEVEE